MWVGPRQGWGLDYAKIPPRPGVRVASGTCKLARPRLVTNSKEVPADIDVERRRNRFETYPDSTNLPDYYTASPLGLADKADGSKRRIHHLSFPPCCPTAFKSCIPEHYGTITYSGIEDGIEAVQKLEKNCILVKRDFASAFRHIPVSPEDSQLLGFHWLGKYYAERFPPFGLRTTLYLFKLLAEVFHWILEKHLEEQNIRVIVISVCYGAGRGGFALCHPAVTLALGPLYAVPPGTV